LPPGQLPLVFLVPHQEFFDRIVHGAPKLLIKEQIRIKKNSIILFFIKKVLLLPTELKN